MTTWSSLSSWMNWSPASTPCFGGGRKGRIRRLQVGSLHMDPVRHQASIDGTELELTAREFDLLEVLARHPGIVLSRGQLLEQVWGYTFEVDGNVVDQFVSYLRRKIEAANGPKLIHTVRGVGFVLRP